MHERDIARDEATELNWDVAKILRNDVTIGFVELHFYKNHVRINQHNIKKLWAGIKLKKKIKKIRKTNESDDSEMKFLESISAL